MPRVLITATSKGIGQATAVELAKRGWRVFATMRDPDKRGPLESALTEAGVRDQVEIYRLDVTDSGSIRDATAAVLSRDGGKLDAVVHNAGIAIGGAFEDFPEEAIRRVMETNFFGVLDLTRALLPTFRAQRRGRIAIVSSEAAFFGLPANSAYSASKWAIEGWAELVAFELGSFGIELILIEPGPYRTSIWQETVRFRPAGSAYGFWVQQVFRAADQHASAMARDPKEVARAISNALEARRPHFRNPVGPFARLNHFLRGKMPSRLQRMCVTRYLGLHRPPL